MGWTRVRKIFTVFASNQCPTSPDASFTRPPSEDQSRKRFMINDKKFLTALPVFNEVDTVDAVLNEVT